MDKVNAVNNNSVQNPNKSDFQSDHPVQSKKGKPKGKDLKNQDHQQHRLYNHRQSLMDLESGRRRYACECRPAPVLPPPPTPPVAATDKQYAQVQDGAIKVQGTEGNDNITLNKDAASGEYYIDQNGTKLYIKNEDLVKVNKFVVEGGAGDDVIDFRKLDKPISLEANGGDGNDKIYGGAGNDLIKGGKGKDQLSGGQGDDQLFGGAGRDVLVGGAGKDLLKGGKGNDLFGWKDTEQISEVKWKTNENTSKVEHSKPELVKVENPESIPDAGTTP